jgi:hypothetical protein
MKMSSAKWALPHNSFSLQLSSDCSTQTHEVALNPSQQRRNPGYPHKLWITLWMTAWIEPGKPVRTGSRAAWRLPAQFHQVFIKQYLEIFQCRHVDNPETIQAGALDLCKTFGEAEA